MTDNHAKDAEPRFMIKGQFIKDLSFESPHAPHSLMNMDKKPKIDINVHLKAQKLQDGFFETILHISAKASTEQGSLFIVDIAYGGIFHLVNISDEHAQRIMLIDGPFLLFPYARRVISDVTRDGGFPPLLLDPIDFHALYLQNAAKTQAASA